MLSAAEGSSVNVAVQLLLSVAGVLVGAVVTYLVSVRDRRRRYVEDMFNAAIAAVVAAQAAMIFINNVPSEAGLEPARAERLEQELREEGYRRFVSLVAEARAAVAAVTPYRPDLRPYVESARGVIESADELTALLEAGVRPPGGWRFR